MWIAMSFPMLFLCFSYAFPMLFLCFSYVFPVVFFRCSYGFLSFPFAFPMLFLCFPYGLAMLSLCFPYAFPMLSQSREEPGRAAPNPTTGPAGGRGVRRVRSPGALRPTPARPRRGPPSPRERGLLLRITGACNIIARL